MTLRLPLRELEEADADPAGYRAKLYGPPRQPQGSTYFNALRNAIFNFHKPEWNAARAEGYLNERLAKAPRASCSVVGRRGSMLPWMPTRWT